MFHTLVPYPCCCYISHKRIFVIQDSNFTSVLANTDFNKQTITSSDYAFDRNTRFISQASFDSTLNLVSIRSDKPHNVKVGDQIIVKNIQSSTNSTGLDDKGYNGTFIVDSIINDKEFKKLAENDCTNLYGNYLLNLLNKKENNIYE